MDYYSTIKKKEKFYHLQQHEWTLESIMISEVIQRKINTA